MATSSAQRRDDQDIITAAFTSEQVQHLNEYQTHTAGGLPAFHPFTCGNRSDGKHGTEGGDIGVLIATEDGWVCPHCDYTQKWAHGFMAGQEPNLVAIVGPAGRALVDAGLRGRIETKLAAYKALAAENRRGAAVMVECLTRRLQRFDEDAARAAKPLDAWAIYNRPREYPDCYVARKWQLLNGNPEPQPTDEVITNTDLDALRRQLPPGLAPFSRYGADDPSLVEVWW